MQLDKIEKKEKQKSAQTEKRMMKNDISPFIFSDICRTTIKKGLTIIFFPFKARHNSFTFLSGFIQ